MLHFFTNLETLESILLAFFPGPDLIYTIYILANISQCEVASIERAELHL